MRPKKSIQLDYEAEMVVVIGKRAKHLTMDNATDCVAGYTCANEGSVREYQRHTTQWGMGKNFDRTGSIGPWMVTADELPQGGKGLKIESRLNGKTMQSSNTDLLMFPVAESLVYLTEGMTLEPGDILLTGTPSGVGHARKPEPVWMKPGDTCEIEIEGIGVLRNPIEDEKALTGGRVRNDKNACKAARNRGNCMKRTSIMAAMPRRACSRPWRRRPRPNGRTTGRSACWSASAPAAAPISCRASLPSHCPSC